MIYQIIFIGIVLVTLVTFSVYVYRNGLTSRAKKILLGLVTMAEAQFGDGTGDIKLSAVTGWLYSAMPSSLQVLFSEETVERWINEAVDLMKEKLCE